MGPAGQAPSPQREGCCALSYMLLSGSAQPCGAQCNWALQDSRALHHICPVTSSAVTVAPHIHPQGTGDFVGEQWYFAPTQKSPLDIYSFPRGLLPRVSPSSFSLSAPQISFHGFSNQTAQAPSSNLLSPDPGEITQQGQNQTKESICCFAKHIPGGPPLTSSLAASAVLATLGLT